MAKKEKKVDEKGNEELGGIALKSEDLADDRKPFA
jgi:hypothetical protein